MEAKRREEGAVELRGPRERIQDFMRRWANALRRSQVPYEGNRVLRVLAVAIVAIVAILLALRALRVFRVVMLPAAIGAIVVVGGWLLIGSLFLPMP